MTWLTHASPTPANAVPAFSMRDLVLAGYAFLESDGCRDDVLQAGCARLWAWIHKHGARYREMSQWTPLATALSAGLNQDASHIRAFWHDEIQPAILGLFAQIDAHLGKQPFDIR